MLCATQPNTSESFSSQQHHPKGQTSNKGNQPQGSQSQGQGKGKDKGKGAGQQKSASIQTPYLCIMGLLLAHDTKIIYV